MTIAAPIVAGLALSACGSKGIDLDKGASADVKRGAQIFHDRCSGCHTLDVTGSEGSATKIKGREKVDGPNFNVRKETYEQALFAIRNGGFSGAIMPQNIAVGKDAKAVARFLEEYSGRKRSSPPTPSSGEPSGTGS
jgi:mono/diheme cytochrome c family protein